MRNDTERQKSTDRADSSADTAADPRPDVGDGVRWALEKGEEAAAIAVGLTILSVNRLQVYRRELSRMLAPSDTSNGAATADGSDTASNRSANDR